MTIPSALSSAADTLCKTLLGVPSKSGVAVSSRCRTGETAQGLERQRRAGVVRLVHDGERTPQPQHVRERTGECSFRAGQQVGPLRRGEVGEMRHELAAFLVHLELVHLLLRKRLPGCHNHDRRGVQRRPRQRLRLIEIEHRHGARLGQRGVIRMLAVSKGLQGLLANDIRRHQPQNDAMVGLQQVPVHQRHAPRPNQSLAAACRHPQAEVRHSFVKAGDGPVTARLAPELLHRPVKRRFRLAHDPALPEIRLHAGEQGLLVFFGGERGHDETPSLLPRPCEPRFRRVNLKVLIHEAEEGGFWAEVPALPGCVSQAETRIEVEANIREAIEGWLAAEEPRLAPADEVIEVTV